VVVCVMACAACVLAGSSPSDRPIDPPYGLARGFGNIMTGWLELPRGIIYENARIPIVGFVVGPVKGAFLTVWRELAGVTDVLCMGLTGKGLYNESVPDFVWDAHWLPQPQVYKATAGDAPRAKKPAVPPCAHQPRAPQGGAPSDMVVVEEVKMIEWTGPAAHSAPTAAACAAPASEPAPASAAAAAPRRKVRVTIPFDLGPADNIDRRIKAMDERISDIEKRAGIWR